MVLHTRYVKNASVIALVSAAMLVGCGKKDHHKKAESAPGFALGVPDAAVGTWTSGLEGLFSVERTFSSEGKGTIVMTVQGKESFNGESEVGFDDTTSPKRITEKLVKINKSSDEVEANVGDVSKCIYDVIDAKTIKVECGEDYPAQFSSEAEVYTKK